MVVVVCSPGGISVVLVFVFSFTTLV